ncbi:MAG: methyltransferase domain-containing protein [Planctomycetota bacterium]
MKESLLNEVDTDDALREYLSRYYGKEISQTEDLEYQACCVDDTKTRYREIYKLIPKEVKSRNYGCGCSLPQDDLTGLTVLDLGSGAGLDAFLAARLVGETGRVIGVDMTDEQLAVARDHIQEVTEAYGYASPNVEFHKGFIETADAVEDESVDVVISDCTINLSPFKDRVFQTIHRVLKPGGEVHISDIVADRRVPEQLMTDRKVVAECLGGALYEYDLFDTMEDVGFRDPRVVSRKLVEENVLGHPIRFYSATVRAFKFSRELDRRCEDYGQVAFYKGNCDEQPGTFILDGGHAFEAGRPAAVCRNTARMLTETRLSRYFEVTPERQHLGIFASCGTEVASSDDVPSCC